MTEEEMLKDNWIIGPSEDNVWLNDDCNEYPHRLEYNTCWKWLMPVVEKIFRTRIGDGIDTVDFACARTFGMINEDGLTMVRFNGFQVHSEATLIEATYKAVIQFIKHYNRGK